MGMYSHGEGALHKARQLMHVTAQRSREGHLSVPAQLAEMLWLKLRRGIGPGYYHVAAFWRRELARETKLQHLGAGEYYKRLAELNPHAYRKLSQNKISEKAILQLFGVPTPRFLGVFHALRGRAAGGGPLCSTSDIARVIEAERLDRLCFKPVEGWGGAGFQAVRVDRSASGLRVTSLLRSESMPLEQFVRDVLSGGTAEPWVLEQYLEQHDGMRAFNPTSVNTMRIWVLQRGRAAPKVLGGYLRIGRAGALVDNQTSGGIIARIDPATGRLRAANDGHVERPLFPLHPDHGAQIEGAEVPCWREAAALAESTLLLFPGIRFAGFDVAVARDGPVVIELNVSPDLQGAAEMELPLRELLVP